MGKIACVAVVKNEARHIAEWIAYQFVIGFDTVVILDNLSTDATRAIALEMAARLDVRVVEAPFEGANFQKLSYFLALEKFGRAFEWMAFFDVDEFLVLDDGISLKARLASLQGVDAVAVNWAIFGSSGHVSRPAGLTISNYLMRSTLDCATNRHVKSIVRPGAVRGYLTPHKFDVMGGYVDLSNRPVAWASDGIIAGLPQHEGGRLHHYFIRSREDFADKIARGYRDLTRQLSDFASADQNDVMDDGAARHADEVTRILTGGRATPAISCAVVLMVKDEAHDIAAWLAWYHVLGFNACIVFDDDSSDGTWEILQRAAGVQDIRVHRTMGPKILASDFEQRQFLCYRYAISQYRDEFEWLAFFDADEFLLLNKDENIQEFLSRFSQADAVAVNWCMYGSNGHVRKPSALPTDAYTRHGRDTHMINRHVKSFVRPGAVGPAWFNVHWFDVDQQRSCTANGTPVVWSDTIGIIDHDPDWTVAKIMHYQCRSQEHFKERVQRRPDISGIETLFSAYDVNEVEDLAPSRLSAQVRRQIQSYSAAAKQRFNEKMIFDIGVSEGNDTAFYLAKGFSVVGVEADVETYFGLLERFTTEISDGRLVIYNAAAAANEGGIVEFFHHNQYQGLSGLSHSRAEFTPGSYQSYHVTTINWAALIRQHGVPYYCKLDIEGGEALFLGSINQRDLLPDFFSTECYSLEPIEQLYALGYRMFKLVDQNSPSGFELPAIQPEGMTIEWHDWHHMSGPFGWDLSGDWVDFDTFLRRRQAAMPLYSHTWFDCHARLK